MGGGSEIKDLNPWKDLIKDTLVPTMEGLVGSAMPAYPGQLSAGSNPMLDFATQFMGRQAMSGGPQAWSQAAQFMQPGLHDNMAQEAYGMRNIPVTNPYAGHLGNFLLGGMYGGGGGGGSHGGRNDHPFVNQFIESYGQSGYPVGWNPWSGAAPGYTGAPPQGQ